MLKSEGAAAVTLQAVAVRVGRTHANLLHHFGSAAGLQRALAEDIAQTVAASIEGVIKQRRAGTATERDVVDAIARVKVGRMDRPAEPVVIESVDISE